MLVISCASSTFTPITSCYIITDKGLLLLLDFLPIKMCVKGESKHSGCGLGTCSLSFVLTLLLSESRTALRQLGSDVTTSLSAQLPTLGIVSRWGLIDVAILHSEFSLSEQNQDATSYNAVFVNTKPPCSFTSGNQRRIEFYW